MTTTQEITVEDGQDKGLVIPILNEYWKHWPTRKNPNFREKYVTCRCGCGAEFSTSLRKAVRGKKTRCSKNSCHTRARKLINKKYGRLLIVRYDSQTHLYECLCDCGSSYKGAIGNIKRGGGCGCLSRELSSARAKQLLPRFSYKGKWVAAIRDIYRGYRVAAKNRGLSFKLSFPKFSALITMPCFYCKIPHSLKWKSIRTVIEEEPFYYNGIDRVNSNLGYVTNNVVSCCTHCNRAKWNFDIKTWKDWLLRISKNLDNF